MSVAVTVESGAKDVCVAVPLKPVGNVIPVEVTIGLPEVTVAIPEATLVTETDGEPVTTLVGEVPVTVPGELAVPVVLKGQKSDQYQCKYPRSMKGGREMGYKMFTYTMEVGMPVNDTVAVAVSVFVPIVGMTGVIDERIEHRAPSHADEDAGADTDEITVDGDGVAVVEGSIMGMVTHGRPRSPQVGSADEDD